jgi:diaminopimelate decarboxylase
MNSLSTLELAPKLHPAGQALLADSALVGSLVDGFGSPLNVLFPHIAVENFEAFRSAYRNHHIRGRVFYAHKPNKSAAVLRALSSHPEAYIDVASQNELRSALGNGFRGERIEATGPKSDDYLALALQHGVLINADSLSELERIVAVKQSLSLPGKTPILIRLTGFHSAKRSIATKDNRFGTPISSVPDIFSLLAQHSDQLSLLGFSFHIENNNINEKIVAIENTLAVTLEAIKKGFQPRAINIGGGFQINLLASESQWHDYVSALKQSVLGHHESMTWNNSGLGFRSEAGTLTGTAAFREHYVSTAGADQLSQLLTTTLPTYGMTFADILREYMLDLYVEPGKAILDQAGLTLATIQHVKHSAKGETVIGLSMNKSNLNAAEIEHMVDPVIIHRTKPEPLTQPIGVYFSGNLCSYSDLIYKHKTFLPTLPSPGDIVAFVNTAGYNMDFVESATLQQPLAEKVAVVPAGTSFQWYRDSQYPLTRTVS